MTRHIAVIGAGNVGSTTAFALAMAGTAETISLVDINHDRAAGEALDLQDGVSFLEPAQIRHGGYECCRGAQVVIITAGAAQQPGQTRMELLHQNAAVMREVIPAVMKHAGRPILLVVTNPVDVLTCLAIKLSGLPAERVLGTGTVLDTARLRYRIGRHCRIDPRNVHGYVIGEHGPGAVPVWSTARIAGIKLEHFCRHCGQGCSAREVIGGQVRNAADQIIGLKGATNYAVALAVRRIVESIVGDQNSVLTVSALFSDFHGMGEICLSLPAVVNGKGIREILPLDLDPVEEEALLRTARSLGQAQDALPAAVTS